MSPLEGLQLDEVLGSVAPPCLSLYQPTHGAHPGRQQDPIRFRNLVKSLEESLQRGYPAADSRSLLEPFHALAADERFWARTLDGLAVLGAPGLFRVLRLQRPVDELARVADSFHLKPLLRIVQSADRYHVLGLGRQEARLFEGNRDALDEIDLHPAVPRRAEDVLGEERKEPHTSVWTYQPGGAGVHHGKGGEKAPELERETELFFRAVDRTVLEHHSRPARLPLLLAGLPQHHGMFRAVSRNPFLLAEGIDVHPAALSREALRERAWRALEPHYLARLAGLVEMFGAARARELGTDDLEQAAGNAAGGRVATLLIQAERREPARDDRLDDVAEAALRNGGQVIVVPEARMPTRTGIAAIYRY